MANPVELFNSDGTPINNANPLKVDIGGAAVTVTLGEGDLQIGAVEIKDATTGTRAAVGANGLAVDVKAMPAITIAELEIKNDDGNPIPMKIDQTGTNSTVKIDSTGNTVGLSNGANTIKFDTSGNHNVIKLDQTGSHSTVKFDQTGTNNNVVVANGATSGIPIKNQSGDVLDIELRGGAAAAGGTNIASVDNNGRLSVNVMNGVSINNTPTVIIDATQNTVKVTNPTGTALGVRAATFAKLSATKERTGVNGFLSDSLVDLSNTSNRFVIYSITISQRVGNNTGDFYNNRGGFYVGGKALASDIVVADTLVANFDDAGAVHYTFGPEGYALPAGQSIKYRLHSFGTNTFSNAVLSVTYREVAPSEVLA